MSNRDIFDRISKWAMKLIEYAVDFEKISTIKSQILWQNVQRLTPRERALHLSHHGEPREMLEPTQRRY
jgi:hypothetical protein